MDKTTLGDRMKGYEATSQSKLLRRTPVIIRLDGKAFHTWTKQLPNFDASLREGPFSDVMHWAMTYTTQSLLNNIQNAVFAYTQSDEISILLNDWKKLETDQWFDAKVQKMASVSASMATGYFNQAVTNENYNFSLALFDARVFNIPREEVTNYFIWRQQDATRNSIQMLGRFYFSHNQMNNKNVSQVQDMLMAEHNVNWNDLETWKKRGTGVHQYGIDAQIPIFTQQRNYVEKFLLEEQDDASV